MKNLKIRKIHKSFYKVNKTEGSITMILTCDLSSLHHLVDLDYCINKHIESDFVIFKYLNRKEINVIITQLCLYRSY